MVWWLLWHGHGSDTTFRFLACVSSSWCLLSTESRIHVWRLKCLTFQSKCVRVGQSEQTSNFAGDHPCIVSGGPRLQRKYLRRSVLITGTYSPRILVLRVFLSFFDVLVAPLIFNTSKFVNVWSGKLHNLCRFNYNLRFKVLCAHHCVVNAWCSPIHLRYCK